MAAPRVGVSDRPVSEVRHTWSNCLRPVPTISHAFIKKWAKAEMKVPQKTLKRGYAFFSGAYVHDVEVKDGCPVWIRAKCFPSMKKNEAPKQLKMSISTSSDKQVDCDCSCTAGKGTCNHSVALLYQLSHFQNLGLHKVPPIASKTSAPQQWHIPPRTHGIKPAAISNITILKTDVPKCTQRIKKKRRTVTGITSTLYNPVRSPLPEASKDFALSLGTMLTLHDQPQILQLLPQDWTSSTLVTSKVGDVPAGSTLAHQQAISQPSDAVLTVTDAPERPNCPVPVLREYDITLSPDLSSEYQSLACSNEESVDYELTTRKQSECPDWIKLRCNRLTSSKFKDVCSRQKDFDALAQRLRRKTVQTSAMLRGLQMEPTAAEVYARHKGVNVYPIGFVINPSAPHLGCSPDRLVYDPTARDGQKWGLLEIKCPDKDSYQDCPYLRTCPNDGQYKLKKVHQYYYQVLGQLGITGFQWCDFMVYCKDDFFVDRISFDQCFFDCMKKKLDLFFFGHFLPCLKK